MLEPQKSAPNNDLMLDFLNDDEAFLDEPTPRKPWWRRPAGIATISGALLLILIVGVAALVRGARASGVTYQFATVRQGTLTLSVSATGPIAAATYPASFGVSGTVSELDVSLGQQVTAGQTLAKLDPTALQDAVNQAQAQANAAYDQEQNNIYTCDNEKNPPPECVQAAENSYAQALASLQTAQDNLAKTTLTAPHAGTVLAINGTVGGSASGSGGSSGGSGSGSSSSSGLSTGFVVIGDLSSLQINASVNEADIGSVATGQNAVFTVSAYSGKAFRGTVNTVSPTGQTSSTVVTYPVTISVTNSSLGSAHLLPGMTATVTITTAQRQGAILVPASAVTFGRTAFTSGLVSRSDFITAAQQARSMLQQPPTGSNWSNESPTAAFVLERNGKTWTIKPVIIGLTNGTTYEVLAGLQAGESVAIGSTGGSASSTAGTSTGTGTGRGTGGGFGGSGFGGGGFGGGGFGGGRGGSGSGTTGGSSGAGSNGGTNGQ